MENTVFVLLTVTMNKSDFVDYTRGIEFRIYEVVYSRNGLTPGIMNLEIH